jgi:Domain of unknown function (DUF4276)
MVTEVRIYIEGGGDGKESKKLLRQGFSICFQELKVIARNNQIKWEIIMCGSRSNAFRDFKNALKDYPNAFVVLLVDSEAPANKPPWEHLKLRDNWNSPNVDDTHCYLMVQTMEAWFIADIDALKKYYGQGFKENSIPKHQNNVEKIPKDSLEPSLKAASSNTTKGEYRKIQHAAKLLEMVDVAKVRKASYHCDRLFITLHQKITEIVENKNNCP